MQQTEGTNVLNFPMRVFWPSAALNASNFDLNVIFLNQRREVASCRLSWGFPRWPLPDAPQFESNPWQPIGRSAHVTSLLPKKCRLLRLLWDFPMGAARRAARCACVCVFENVREKSPTPLPFPPCLCFLQAFHYPPSLFSLFSTTSHPLKHSITL